MEEITPNIDNLLVRKINEIIRYINDKEKRERETYNSLMESYGKIIKERDDKSNS